MKVNRLIKLYKPFFLIVFFVFITHVIIAQRNYLYIDSSALLSVKKGFIYIPGNLKIHNNGKIHNEDSIYLKGNIINGDGALFESSSILAVGNDAGSVNTSGNVIFNGTAEQRIQSKSDKIAFSRMTILSTPFDVVPDTSFYVFGGIRLTNGSLRLNGKNISTFTETPYLNSGFIWGENNKFRVYDTITSSNPLVLSGIGFVKSLAVSSASENYKTLGMELTNPNNLYIDRAHISLNNAGDGSIRKYYKITKKFDNANKSSIQGNITVTYLDSADYEGLGIREPDFRLFLKQNPVDPSSSNSVVEYRNWGGSLNTVNNTITTNLDPTTQIPDGSIWTIADQNCKNPPIADLGVPTLNVCENTPFIIRDTITQNNYSSSIYYRWFVNDVERYTSASVIYDTIQNYVGPIKYKVQKIDNRGCITFDSVMVTIRPLPIANYKKTHSFYCQEEQIAFADSSSIADGSELSNLWTFGDGYSAVSATIDHSYSDPKQYSCFHIVTSEFGCMDTISFQLNIKAIPKVNFSTEQGCNTKEILFHNLSTSNEAFYSASWEYEPGNSVIINAQNSDSVKQNFRHVYTTTGQKVVKLLMVGSGGCSAQVEKEIVVNDVNTLQFVVSNVCFGSPIGILNTSSIKSVNPSYLWDFGDTTTSNVMIPHKTYSYPGVFDVKFKVSTPGCTDSIIKRVYVHALPKAGFTTSNACAGKEIKFEPLVLNQGTYAWDINGVAFTIAQPLTIFSNSGSFRASLTVTSDSGCMASSGQNFSVFAMPKSKFTSQNVCFGNAMSFYNQSTVQGGTLSYVWDFGDGLGSANTNPVHTYTDSAGIRNVKLVTKSNNGCIDSIEQNIEVYPLPYKGLPASLSTGGSSLTLDATVYSAKYTVLSYIWSNGVQSAINKVTSNNTYTVTMSTSNGCVASESVVVSLFTKVDPKLPENISFCGSGTLDALYPDGYCTWSTGEHTRKIKVSQSGTYSVYVKDENNFEAWDTVMVTIHSVPDLELGSDRVACAGDLIHIDAGSGASSYKWSTSETNSVIIVNAPGTYSVTVTSAEGCSASDKVAVVFHSAPVKVLPLNISGCKQVLLDAGNSGSVYSWNNSSIQRTIEVNESGIYWVTITNENNCSLTDTTIVTILPAASVNLGADLFICEGSQVTLNAGDNGASYTYRWNGNSFLASAYIVTKQGKYVVEAINTESGCISGDTVRVYYKTTPVVNLGNDRMMCTSDNILLDAGNAGSLIQWGSSSGTTSIQQTIVVNTAGKYWVTVLNSNGCMGYDTITVYPSGGDLVAEFIAASDVKASDTVHFVNVSYPLPYTCLWKFGDGVTSIENSPSHLFYIRDTFNVKLTISNRYCAATISKPIIVRGFTKGSTYMSGADGQALIEILSSNLYPNPTDGNFTFEILFSESVNVTITLYDIRGALHYIETIKNVEELVKSYSFGKIPPGIYILKAFSGNLSKTYKIVKQGTQ